MEIVKLYLKGLLSFGELENILGRDKASLVHTFAADSGAGKIGELLLSGLRGYMV